MKESTKHILVIRLSSVGDIVLATPLLEELRKCFPAARITWLTDSGYADLLKNNPNLDRVLEFDRRGRHKGPLGMARVAKEVGEVDWVIDLQHKLRTIILSAFLRPRRTSVLVKRRGFDTLKAILGHDPISGDPHQIQRYLRIMADGRARRMPEDDRHLPEPGLWLDAALRAQTAERIVAEAAGLPVMGLVMGSRHAIKRWPQRHQARLADLASGAGLRVLFVGGEEERDLIMRVADMTVAGRPVVRVGGSLMQLAATLACCSVVVAPDSGPAHMAAALGIPVVTLFGPTSPHRWAPVGARNRVVRLEIPCSPCTNHAGARCPIQTHECMEKLSPERVFAEVQSVRGETR